MGAHPRVGGGPAMAADRPIRILDAHSHFYPSSYLQLLAQRTEPPKVTEEGGVQRFVLFDSEDRPGGGRPIASSFWDLDEKVAFMDEHGIDVSIVSLGNPWLDPFPTEGAQLARELNREFGMLADATDGRLVGMGVLPSNTVETAVEVVHEIAGNRMLRGVIIGTRVCGLAIDDPALEPVWASLEASEMPVLLHPHYSIPGDLDGYASALPVALGFPFETTIAVSRLALAGTLRRHPGLRILASHGGGTMPFLAGRLDATWRSATSLHERLPTEPSVDLARLYLDAILYDPTAAMGAAHLVGIDHLLFGTDHPFPQAEPQTILEAIRLAFGPKEQRDVLVETARRLFDLGA